MLSRLLVHWFLFLCRRGWLRIIVGVVLVCEARLWIRNNNPLVLLSMSRCPRPGDQNGAVFVPEDLRPAFVPRNSGEPTHDAPQCLMVVTKEGVKQVIVMELYRAPCTTSDGTGVTQVERRKRLMAHRCSFKHCKEMKVVFGTFRHSAGSLVFSMLFEMGTPYTVLPKDAIIAELKVTGVKTASWPPAIELKLAPEAANAVAEALNHPDLVPCVTKGDDGWKMVFPEEAGLIVGPQAPEPKIAEAPKAKAKAKAKGLAVALAPCLWGFHKKICPCTGFRCLLRTYSDVLPMCYII